ncbi:Acyl-coenzyme A oxidase [Venustampulla echinocandica]|uniref:Acyl-coenzyme A oxidase n=1 Tax=Venustampulla echinocandica TaxID=2656787 RepID=A0A370TRF7_9HELO|nr:Acyl-coenzyme A oxidase [Venustampulla echinocandica]RDL38112.1 Acyl-coenzyme A oxidase [Venustampulla echinocandica]
MKGDDRSDNASQARGGGEDSHGVGKPAITQTQMMESARNQATFDTSKLSEIIFGSPEAVKIHKKAFQRVEESTGTTDMSKLPARYGNMNREDMLLEGLRAGRAAFHDSLDNGDSTFRYHTQEWVLTNSNPLGLTEVLFRPMIELQGTAEQIAYWTPLSRSGKIIGSYTQTEIGQGTFVAGLETTAVFDKRTDEFVINSPTLSSIKFWPGALGYMSSHTIVIARLIIGEKDYGVHAFIVQLRSLKDWKPLPGIELGDIGLKMAYNGTDNGYAVFNNARIPRSNLLMRFASVSRDGAYTTHPLREKLLYGGMLKGRLAIIRNSAFQLAQALTIATRYSVVRRQGHKQLQQNSVASIMSYKLQHYRLLMLISRAYASLFASLASDSAYQELQKQQANGDHSSLSYTHMVMAGLKAWVTANAADAAEDARKMCGGHGYLMISGLPEIVNSLAATCTFEGENYVMWKQVASYLMKGMAARSLPKDMAYIPSPTYGKRVRCHVSGVDFLHVDNLLYIFQHRAARLITEAYQLLRASRGKGAVQNEDRHDVVLLSAAKAHTELYILQSFREHVTSISGSMPTEVKAVLTRLVRLFALTTIASPLCSSSASFVEDGFLTLNQLGDIRTNIDHLLEELQPDAIALTDAWEFTDASLTSALGCKDGDVYERMMCWIRQLPINVHASENDSVFRDGWEEVIRDFIAGGRGNVTEKARL